MTIIRIEEVIIPERRYPKEIKICDICDEEATGRIPCQECKKDLCSRHHIDIRLRNYEYGKEKEIEGIYCRTCLITKLIFTFPGEKLACRKV